MDAELLKSVTFQPEDAPTTYVCGPTPFVETVADLLVAAGHDPVRVRTERITAAIGQCAGCGRTGVFAETRVYMDAPGLVARCSGCDDVLLRVVTTPTDTYVDLRGLTYLRFSNPS